jgi:phospholipid transport system substrate-binding protein
MPLLLASAASFAEETTPDALVKNVTEEVLTVLREDQALQAGDQHKAIKLIEEKIGPHFDFARMTQLAVGQGWRQAAPAQREALTREFRTLLVRTYANALTSYKDQTVDYKPTRPAGENGATMVRTQINQPSGQPIAVDYRLAKNTGQWKVFDVSIDHVSLVTNYRSSFSSELAKGGPDALIRTLREKNRAVAPAPDKGGRA